MIVHTVAIETGLEDSVAQILHRALCEAYAFEKTTFTPIRGSIQAHLYQMNARADRTFTDAKITGMKSFCRGFLIGRETGIKELAKILSKTKTGKPVGPPIEMDKT